MLLIGALRRRVASNACGIGRRAIPIPCPSQIMMRAPWAVEEPIDIMTANATSLSVRGLTVDPGRQRKEMRFGENCGNTPNIFSRAFVSCRISTLSIGQCRQLGAEHQMHRAPGSAPSLNRLLEVLEAERVEPNLDDWVQIATSPSFQPTSGGPTAASDVSATSHTVADFSASTVLPVSVIAMLAA